MSASFEAEVTAVAALSDPVRRSLYLFVAESAEAVSREQAAAAVGVQRSLAAFHLDKLADEGLLEFEFRRLTGRTGPGAGRPAKLYRRSARQVEVTLPPREYDVAGRLLAEAITAAAASGRSVEDELSGVAAAFGRRIGEQAVTLAGRRASPSAWRDALVDVLRGHGFEPRVVDGDVALANCPFHALSRDFTELVCGMNLQIMQGVRGALQVHDGELQPRLEPAPGQCCVRFCSSP